MNRTIALLLALSLTVISYFYLDTGVAQFIYRILNSNDRLLQTAADIPDLLLHIVIMITVLSVVPRPSVCATGHPSPLAPSVSRRYSASQAPAVLRLRSATVTLRLAKLGYRGLRAIAFALPGAQRWAGYFVQARRGIHNRLTNFLRACGTVVPMAFVAKTGLQYVFGRPDPYAWLLTHEPPCFYWFRDDEGYGGFPSGHMTVFAALMTTSSYYYPRYRSVYLGSLCLLALALIITDHHFLSDVLAGALLGWILAFITITTVWKAGVIV
jgi:membrane-associated phospholipid phosphatase